MFVLTFILIFLAVGAGCWFSGLWNNVLTLINVIFAGLIATSFFEPLADLLEESMGEYTYWLDMIAVWLLFFVSFGAFRMATELLSQFRVKFNNIVELVGKSILSVWIAWVFVCFSMFTMHLSPVEPAAFGGSFQGSPTQTNFIGLGPDRMWLAFIQSRSMGPFSEFRNWEILPEYKERVHPDDADSNARVFDSTSEFIIKYRQRRQAFADLESELTDN